MRLLTDRPITGTLEPITADGARGCANRAMGFPYLPDSLTPLVLVSTALWKHTMS